jgi:Tfp pilus assembly protein PilO
MASVLVPGDLSVIAMRIPDPICSTLHDPELKHSPNSTQPLLRLSAMISQYRFTAAFRIAEES